MSPRRFAVSLALLLGGCATTSPPPPAGTEVIVEEASAWERAATAEDQDRIRRLDQAWSEGIAAARRYGRKMREEGRLLDREAALPRPAPSPGSYMCRLIRLGSADRKEPAFAAYKPFFCYVGVDKDQLSITKQTGSQRPAGYLWDDSDTDRLIFLGSLAPDEGEPRAYGEDPARDIAGVFERIGAFRYRLVIPMPKNGAKLELYELTPAPVQDN